MKVFVVIAPIDPTSHFITFYGVWYSRRNCLSRSCSFIFYFHLTCVHSALELSGRCALQIYLLTYFIPSHSFIAHFTQLYRQQYITNTVWIEPCISNIVSCTHSPPPCQWGSRECPFFTRICVILQTVVATGAPAWSHDETHTVNVRFVSVPLSLWQDTNDR